MSVSTNSKFSIKNRANNATKSLPIAADGTSFLSLADLIITAFKARLVVEKSLEYQGHRANTYPQVTEQLDQLYHDMKDGKLGVGATTGSWYVGITSVKTLYPKP